MTRFKESTGKQVLLILVVIAAAVGLLFYKVPRLQVYALSWKLSFSSYSKIDLFREMIEVRHPAVLEVLLNNLHIDDEDLPSNVIEKLEDFDGRSVGDYAAYLINKHSTYELDLEGTDRYSRPVQINAFKVWLEASVDHLVWNEANKKFVDPRVPLEE